MTTETNYMTPDAALEYLLSRMAPAQSKDAAGNIDRAKETLRLHIKQAQPLNGVRMKRAGSIQLLCEASTVIEDDDDLIDRIEQCVSDWCKDTDFKYQRSRHGISIL